MPGAVSGRCYAYNMAEKKAVLNVTVAESIADAIRRRAAVDGVTISSIVEAVLARELEWYKIRANGLAAMDELYQQIGRPTAEEEAAAAAWVDNANRLLDEARAAEERNAGRHSAGVA
jgi:hypothetical protein